MLYSILLDISYAIMGAGIGAGLAAIGAGIGVGHWWFSYGSHCTSTGSIR